MMRENLAIVLGFLIGNCLYGNYYQESVEGLRVVVTGASSGIGEQLAYEFARAGAHVLVTARRETALKQVTQRMVDIGRPDGHYSYLVADMSNVSSISNFIQRAVDRLSGVDVLLLNHITVLPLGEWTGNHGNLTALQQALDVNFKAYVHLASSTYQQLHVNHGRLIVVSSFAGKIATPFVAAYSASKFALDGFFSSWRQELLMKKSPVSITLAIIGLIGTDSAVSNIQKFGQQFLLNMIKPASAEDAARAILRAGTSREREVYFPYLAVRIPCLLRDWMPAPIEHLLRYIAVPSHYR